VTDAQKQRIYDAIMRGIPKPHEGDWKGLLAKLTCEEIERIAPVVDEIAHEAYEQGFKAGRPLSCEQILRLEPE
jgi:hypothetical protein